MFSQLYGQTECYPISVLRKLRTPKAFARFVQDERAAGRMKRDDTTLIALW